MPNSDPIQYVTLRVMNRRQLHALDTLIGKIKGWDDRGYDLKWEIFDMFAINDGDGNGDVPGDVAPAVALFEEMSERAERAIRLLDEIRDEVHQ